MLYWSDEQRRRRSVSRQRLRQAVHVRRSGSLETLPFCMPTSRCCCRTVPPQYGDVGARSTGTGMVVHASPLFVVRHKRSSGKIRNLLDPSRTADRFSCWSRSLSVDWLPGAPALSLRKSGTPTTGFQTSGGVGIEPTPHSVVERGMLRLAPEITLCTVVLRAASITASQRVVGDVVLHLARSLLRCAYVTPPSVE